MLVSEVFVERRDANTSQAQTSEPSSAHVTAAEDDFGEQEANPVNESWFCPTKETGDWNSGQGQWSYFTYEISDRPMTSQIDQETGQSGERCSFQGYCYVQKLHPCGCGSKPRTLLEMVTRLRGFDPQRCLQAYAA